ncbi:carbohydrate-binding protein [Micromonospora rubida]|uniref:carbohydrate-binding protein n=1 Tax=Micromonospora rubida TaxID=2697657 RepID=UPI001F373BB4|nr:carbohydrate-binding protein [Micromonospora rubida]
MRRRPATMAAALLGAAATVLTFTLTAQADPGADPAPGGPSGVAAPDGLAPEMFAALQRDLRLTPAQARARLDTDARAGRVQQVLRATLGSRYGGAWVTPDGTAVTVGVTTAADAATVRDLGAVPARVRHGEQALAAVVDRLDRRAGDAPDGVTGWYADLPTNSVVVLARPGGDAAAEAFAVGAPAGTVRVQATTEDPRPYADVIGGNAYYIGSSRCSIGFSVQGGFVTAGHCGRVGARTSQPGGTFRGSTFPGRDYAWVQVDAGNTPRGLVNTYSGGTVAVAGSTEAAVGAAVCRSGSTTGWRCGTIQQKNASVTYPEGTVSGLTRSNACAEPGDSGGSWLAGSQAQGVTSGGSGNCTSGGTMYFQPVNPILAAYGLSLITSGGGPTPTPTGTSNPPGDTTWQAGTSYAAGATVIYAGQSYRCLQGHTAQVGWEPPNVPALWQQV